MSSLRNLISRLFSFRRQAYTVSIPILGLDYAGKTTLLYKLKLGKVVQTIPSIGFAVEEVEVQVDGEKLHMFCWDLGTGCGGLAHMKKLISMCIERANAIVWMVDSSDRPRLQESVEILKEILDLTDFVNGKIPILVLANKQDIAGAMSLDEIRKAFATPLTGYTFNVFRCACLQEVSKSGVPEAFHWLRLVLQLSPVSSNTTNEPLVPTSKHADLHDTLAEKLDSWVTRASNDVPADEYLSLFEAFKLPSWDHYAHVRVAYIILTKFGRQKGKDLIFNGIERYIKESGQAGGRTFHLTMTYLWIQLVHFGIQNTAASSLPMSTPPSEKSPNVNPSSTDDFARFLLLNSYVVDGNIWSTYYSKDVIMTPAAKAGLVLPDKKPLPSILSRDAV